MSSPSRAILRIHARVWAWATVSSRGWWPVGLWWPLGRSSAGEAQGFPRPPHRLEPPSHATRATAGGGSVKGGVPSGVPLTEYPAVARWGADGGSRRWGGRAPPHRWRARAGGPGGGAPWGCRHRWCFILVGSLDPVPLLLVEVPAVGSWGRAEAPGITCGPPDHNPSPQHRCRGATDARVALAGGGTGYARPMCLLLTNVRRGAVEGRSLDGTPRRG